MPLPLEDYAMIGDCQTAALIGRDGSIDWLCLPSFDSAACFAAILGGPQNGRWLLAPVHPIKTSRRRYRDNSLILETDYDTSDGMVTVIDCMPPRGNEPDLIRTVVGRSGKVRMRMEMIIRFDYGSIVPWVRRVAGGISAIAGPDTIRLVSPVTIRGEDLTTVAEFVVEAGDEVPFVLTWHASHVLPPARPEAKRAVEFTDDWWRKWSARCTYEGPWREAVLRSLITLKALTFAPTGGIVAAPTTSLPEQPGGVRNWDYRFCWLRDATFTLYSLLMTGYTTEAEAFRDWLLRAVAGNPSKLQIMYSIFGKRRLEEVEIDWLGGYEHSKPVHIGNAASRQFQLDVYGEVIDMLCLCRRKGLPESDDAWRFELAILQFLEEAWTRPDEGIWEVRGPRRHFTHSKMMAWVAFDRAIKSVEKGERAGPLEHWRSIRRKIHEDVCTKGFNSKLGSFVQFYGSDLLDASLLMMPLVGFLPASDSRVQETVQAISRGLMRDGFVNRYTSRPEVDGLPHGEASFLPCSFWLVDNLALLGKHDEAVEMFECLLSVRNDLGLLAEEYGPAEKRLLGNFPQAFSHVGLVNSACNLASHGGPAMDRKNS